MWTEVREGEGMEEAIKRIADLYGYKKQKKKSEDFFLFIAETGSPPRGLPPG